MSVSSYSVHVFVCICDDCGARADVEESRLNGIYNGAQAVRSLGWSFGQDKSVRCGKCRRRYVDKYKNRTK